MPVGVYAGANVSNGNGVTTVFPYNFKVLDKTHVEVKVDGVVKALGADYDVTGVGNSNGGNVVFNVAPANLSVVQRARVVPYKRDTDYQANGDLREDTLDPDLDLIEMQLQQAVADALRSFKAPKSVTADQVLTDAMWAARASMSLGFDAAGNFGVFVPVAQNVSAAMLPVVQSATVGVARGALGISAALDPVVTAATKLAAFNLLSPNTTKGDFTVFDGANNVRLPVGTDAYGLRAEAGAGQGLVWEPPIFSDCPLVNATLQFSVNANALTIAVKRWDGQDPSAANPAYVLMRDSVVANNLPLVRKITGALSIVIPAGATLGHVSGRDQHLFVYFIDNAGAIELAVSNLPPDYKLNFGPSRRINTTAITAAATNAAAIYATNARANLAWVSIAKCISNQAVAGTWAAVPTQVDLAPFRLGNQAARMYNNSGGTATTAAFTKIPFDTVNFDAESIIAATAKFQPKLAGQYRVTVQGVLTAINTGRQLIPAIYVNGAIYSRTDIMVGGTNQAGMGITDVVDLNGTSDYVEGYLYNGDTVNQSFTTGSLYCYASINRVSPGVG